MKRLHKINKKNKYLQNLSKNKNEVVSLAKETKKSDQLSFKEFQEFVYISTEKNKPDFDTNIRDEYMEKVLFFGYVMVNQFLDHNAF